MRVVAKVQFTTGNKAADPGSQVLTVLDRWRDRKFANVPGGDLVIRQSGASAAIEQQTDMMDGARLDSLIMLEPIADGSLQTEVGVLADQERTVVRCVLKVGSDVGLVPTTIALRPPRFIRDMIGLPFDWTVGHGGEGVFAQSFTVDADNLPELADLMNSPIRRLPIVIVSELDGETLAGDLHERLGQDLSGLAHVVRLTADGSWALTQSQGREWSCYNGAIRLLWPFQVNRGNARTHPLWTSDQLMHRFDTAVLAREHLRSALAHRILEASTFVADDPGFDAFATARLRAAEDRSRATAQADGDFVELAESYAIENAALRVRVDEQRASIEQLQRNIESLTLALRSSFPDEDAEREEAPPQTVTDAVASARRELAGKVAIASETDNDIAALNPIAGPPEKLLRYLRTLGDLADALARGSIGQAVPQWLKLRNVECSVDSETTKNSEKGKRFRLRKVEGELVDCEYHLKPADKVKPDMCARIYFATAMTAPYVKVGYVGRHID